MSPAVASTPSPTPTIIATGGSLASTSTSPPPPPPVPVPVQQLPIHIHRYLDASELEVGMTDVSGGGGQEEGSPGTANVSVAGGDDQELVEDLSEMV